MDCSSMKADENMYFCCRKEAKLSNDNVCSREKASELLGVSVSTLSNYELGITTPPVDIIERMSEIYNTPELRNAYCKFECPLGKSMAISTDASSIERAVLRVIKKLDDKEVTKIATDLIDIAEDGVIDDQEVGRLNEILSQLDSLSTVISELKIIGEKRLHRK